MTHKRYILLSFLLLLWSDSACAFLHKGLAHIQIRNSRTVLELTQFVTLSDSAASFVNLDDWGTESFSLVFSGGTLQFVSPNGEADFKSKSLKKLLSLPLTQDEFLAILRFEKPAGFSESIQDGVVSWKKPGYKKMQIVLQNFGTISSGKKPADIRIEYKKNLFQLQWLKS